MTKQGPSNHSAVLFGAPIGPLATLILVGVFAYLFGGDLARAQAPGAPPPNSATNSEQGLLDISVVYEARRDSSGALTVQSLVPASGVPLDPETTNLLDAISGLPTTQFPAAQNFEQSIALLQSQSATMTAQEKLFLLSRLGTALAQGYDYSLKNATLEQVFENLKTSGHAGGICGDIHTYLARAETALGFSAAALTSGTTARDNHFDAIFKDSTTGHYYVQNYGQIVATNATTVQEAVDISTRLLGPLTGASSIESLPGLFHTYIPRTARWVNEQLDQGASFEGPNTYIVAKLSNANDLVEFQLRHAFSDALQSKAFLVHSLAHESEGDFQLDAVGVSSSLRGTKLKAWNGLIDDLTYSVDARAGGLQISTPTLFNNTFAPLFGTQDQNRWTRDDFFAGVNIRGSARINQFTGKLEFAGQTIDYKNKSTGSGNSRLDAGLAYQPKNSNVTLGLDRTFEFVPRDSGVNLKLKPETSYDKVSIIIDSRGDKTQPYLSYRGELYIMEGFAADAARGLRHAIQAVVPSEQLGDFSVVLDINRITHNTAKDPFYDVPASSTIKAAWRKSLTQATEIGAEVSREDHQPYFAFEEPGQVTPGLLNSNSKRVRGYVWIRHKM